MILRQLDRDDIRRLDVDRLDLGPDVDEVEIDTAEVAEAFELHEVWVISANLLDDEQALVQIEAEMDVALETTVEVQLHRTLFDEDDWPRGERRTLTLDRTVLVGAEATYRRDTQELDEMSVFHVSA